MDFDTTLNEMRVSRLYFLGMEMTPKEMVIFKKYAKRMSTKRELETMRLVRARFMRNKRLRKMM